MEEMKKLLEETGILKTKNISIETFTCAVNKCNKEYRTNKRYQNHMKLMHPERCIVPTNTISYYAEPTTTKPALKQVSTQTHVNNTEIVTVDTDITNHSKICATVWSTVRLGYTDTFCEEIKKMMSMQQNFYSTASENGRSINNLEPFTNVTQTPFRKIVDLMANNIRQQLIERIKQSRFYSLHIGETADIPSFAHLFVTVRYLYEPKKTIIEDLLFWQVLNWPLVENKIFAIVDTVIQQNGLEWKNCVGISMDGGSATTEPLKHFVERLTQKDLTIRTTYTMTRRGNFIKGNLGTDTDLKDVLSDVIKLVNEFKMCDGVKLANQIETKFRNVFIHTEDYWLSYGNVLQTMFHMAQYRKVSVNILSQLAYIIDIIDHFNRLSVSLQKTETTIFDVYDRISAMYDKLGTYKDEVRNNNFISFPNLREIYEQYGIVPNDTKFEIKNSLRMLQHQLPTYLPMTTKERVDCEWIRHPFDFDGCPGLFTTRDEITEWKHLVRDKIRGIKVNNLVSFWITNRNIYPNLSERAIKFLLIFKSSRFFETGFGAFVDMRTKAATDLNSEYSYLRIKLSPIKPDVVQVQVK